MAPKNPTDPTTLPDCWKLFEAAQKHSTQPIVLYGPSGIGKTFGVVASAKAASQPCYKIQVTEETGADEPRGRLSPVPVREGSRLVGTVLDWQDGPLLKGIRSGGWVLWDDLHRIGPDILGLLYLAAESRESLTLALPTGEIITAPHKNYRTFATSNTDPTETLDEALLSRFCIRILIDRPHPDALALFPEKWRGLIAESVSLEDPKRRTSLREWFAFSELVGHMGEMKTPATLLWGARGMDVINSIMIGTGSV